MNIGDTSGLKDEKKMDSNKVWQWRIVHAKKYSICPEPFHYSNEIGLTFNVASSTQKKLDLDLLTNGVILEVCDFAKTVTKGKGRFITQILENNFDLGLENEQQRVDFTTQILHKVKDLIRKPPENKREVFMIFDKPSNLECTNNSNNGLHMACTEGKTDSFPVEADDTDDGEEEDQFNYSQATSKEYMTENLSDSESDESKQKCSGPQATTELNEVLPFSFPYCEEVGLRFDNGSKQSLDLGLFTKGVMLELVHFARVLTTSYNRIILDVLEHNFELDLKNEQVKNQVLFKVSHLLKRRKQLNITGNNTEFKKEPFAFQTNPFKGPSGSSLSNEQEKSALLSEQSPEEHRQGQSKHMETNTLFHKTTLCTSRKTEGDHSDTYAQEESDKQGHIKHPKYTDVPRESDSSCLTTTDISSILPFVNTIGNPPFETQPDKRGFCGDEEETQTPRSGLNKSDIEQEEMGTEYNMWKLRSNRVAQILSALTKDFGQFNKSKTVGLEYNVGFGPKQNISVESLKDTLLLEIGTFAVAMNSSQKDFIVEILEYNFDLNLPSQHHRNIFASDIMTRVRQLRSCGDALKFSNEVFKLPRPSINMTAQSIDGVGPELTSRLRMEKFDVSPLCPSDSHAETKEHISRRSGDLYPLCKEIGLNLHVNNSQPNKKLQINKLTNGTMTEVADFAEKLCGTFEQICVDILRHNLDFDLQRDSELAKNIFARISALIEQRNLSMFPKTYKNMKRTMNDVSTMEKQDCPDNPNLNTCSAGSSQAAVMDQNVGSSTDTKHQNDLDLKMWKLRANHIQRILSMPHKEHCPLYSYSRCKKLGIDFNVGSGIKQNLDPKFLTNGIMFELNNFATVLLSAQKYFIIEILEHNFDLHFENEQSRSGFADEIMRKIIKRGMRKRQLIRKTSLMKKTFELPDVRCIEQPSYAKTLHCPKCYQDQKFHEDDSDPGYMHRTRPHTMSDTVSADVKCTTQKHAKDVSSVFSTTERTIIESHPHCKKMGLNLCVDKDLPRDKFDMHVLTNSVMMEVFQFAKKLCGTYNVVINDILEHNFNLDIQSLDLTPAELFYRQRSRNDGGPAWYNKVFDIQSYSSKPPGRISKVKQESALRRSERMEIIKEGPLALQTKQERANMPSGRNQSVFSKSHMYHNVMCAINMSTMGKQDCPDSPNLDTCSAGSSQAAVIDQNAGSSTDAKHQNDLDLKMWKLRANHIQRILSVPHQEYCPFYSYSRCRKLGIDFNIGSGVKQNLDPKLLTNGIMVELYTFATELHSAQKHFIMEVLEYNFDLNFENELCRRAFAKQVMMKISSKKGQWKINCLPFELPDTRCIQEPICGKSLPCPKCHQDQNHEVLKDKSDPVYMHHPQPSTMTGTDSTDVNCTAQQPTEEPSSTFFTAEEMIMEGYSLCKEIGLSLCVDKNKTKNKLDTHILTYGILNELASFARKLCGTKCKVLIDVLEHNFNIGMLHQPLDPKKMYTLAMQKCNAKATNPNWYNEVFVLPTTSDRPRQLKRAPAIQKSNCLESIKKRRLALHSSQSPCQSQSVIKSKPNHTICMKRTEGSCVHQVGHHSDANHFSLLSGAKSEEETCSHDENTQSSTDQWTMNIQNPGLVSVGCGSPLWENIQIKKEEYDPYFGNIEPEEVTEETYHPQHVDMKTESIIAGVEHLAPYESPGSLGNTVNEDHLENPTSTNIPRESESRLLVGCATFPTPTDVSSTFPTTNTNVNLPFTRGTDGELCGNVGQTETPRSVLDKCDMKQEEMETEHNMWKFRANRVEQILSTPKSGHSAFFLSGKISLEFNVGFGLKQNIGVDFLTDGVLLEIAKFALAMNSSQKDFIVEILEYNFDLNLPSQHHRNIFASHIMTRVRQLRSCGDAVKFSNEVFELPRPSINMTAQSIDGVGPELTSRLRMEKVDVSPVCPPDSHAETKERISCRIGDLYPLCKEIGLNLHVNNSQPNKKLEINKLTNGTMTEVANFAEKLCGTFEQICVDILRHNLDFDLQRDSERAKNIFARISALIEQRNLSMFPKTYKNMKRTMNDVSTMEKQDCPDNPNLNTCSAGSSQAAVMDQNVGSSADTEHQNDLDLKIWKLRASHVQRILSMPHKEHCPLYSYSRCKKLGIDFNVGSGIKQNLDPKFLTNGIMFELNNFATALLSAQKYVITEILEHNFDLHFENEQSRSAFAAELLGKIKSKRLYKSCFNSRQNYMKKPFELPDVRCIEEPSYGKTQHCSKCYRDQNVHEDESDPCHRHHPCPRTMSDTVSADVKCTTQKYVKDASSIFSTTEETIMDSHPHCKKIGLNLCVDKDLPRDKLDMHVLTNSVMRDVVRYAKKICGTPGVIINDVLEHNFNITMSDYHLYPIEILAAVRMPKKVTDPDWLNEVFVLNRPRQLKQAPVIQKSNCLESIKKRQLALQTKQERANLPSGSGENPYPACTVIGLVLNVTSNSGEKVILDLKLLTRAVVFEIHKFATLEAVNYYPRTVFDILDYNFDLSSQHYRRWEFSIATAMKIQTMVKDHCKNDDNTEDTDEVFKLPFMFDPETSQQHVENKQDIKGTNSSMDTATESNSSSVHIHKYFLSSANMLSSLPTVNSNVTSKIGNQPDERGFYGDEEQTQTPGNAPNDCDMEQKEIRTDNYYTCPLGESDLEPDEVSDSENTGKQNHLQNPQSFFPSTDIVSELKSSCMGIHAPFFTSINHQSDIEQEEMGTEHNMWKLRSNRVEQILSALTKDFGPFNRSKRFGLEYNVGFGPKQNTSVESLMDSLLFEIGKFALAMNSSQKDFIMEILEYNFDLNLPSQHYRNVFASDIMTRVRQLRSCGDAVKFSNEVFKLPGLVASVNMTAESECGVIPEKGMSKMGKCDVAPVCPSDSHAETKEHISRRSGDLYPLCKEIGLNLHVNNSQPNKKLEINKLTNGAMTEVADFAEKLCGTFDQICLDILRHNLDFDLQRDSEFAKNILARIPALIERRNKSVFSKFHRNMKRTMNDMSTMEKQDCPDSPNLDTCSAGSSQAAVMDQNVGSSADTEHLNDLDLKMWKLRANYIQRILSVPHQEYCPFYSYSRCSKLGIDFNVGSGVKQYLDPKLLTNGVMVELNTFATELHSAQRHFIMEVLEYNFEFNFENELSRSAFEMQILSRKGQWKINCLPFELPDTRCIPEPICGKSLPCPKCYQDQNHEVLKDKSDPVHMHHPQPSTMTGTDSTDVNCTGQQPTEEPSSTAEERIMESYPLCKEIGLNLCVDKDKPKNKLDTRVLTYGILGELSSFAKKLCGSKPKVLIDLLKHNFNIGILHQHLNPAGVYVIATPKRVADPDWVNEVFVFNRPRQLKRAPVIQKSHFLESIKKRRLALQLSQSQSQDQGQGQDQDQDQDQGQGQGQGQSVIKSKPNYSIRYPLCSEIGLDLDVTSESVEKEKMDLKVLTTAVVAEIHKFACKKTRYYYPRTVFDILDYNFDLSSQHHNRLEFSIATASKLQKIAKRYRKNRDRPDEVFKLPFVFKKVEKTKCKKNSKEKPVKKRSSCVRKVGLSDVKHVNLLSGVQTEKEPCSHDDDTKSSIDHWMMNIQNPGLESTGCGSPLQENIQLKKEEYGPHYDKPELDTEEKYHPQHVNVKTESITGGVEHLVPYEPPGSLGNTVNYDHLKNSTSTDIPGESESRLLVGCATFPTPVDVSSTLPTANIQNPGLVRAGCGSPLQENIQIKKEYDPHYVKQEPDTEEKYHPQHVDVKPESNICDAEQLTPCEPAGSHGYAGIATHPNSERNINTQSENECFTESHVQIELDTPGINLIIIDESYEVIFL